MPAEVVSACFRVVADYINFRFLDTAVHHDDRRFLPLNDAQRLYAVACRNKQDAVNLPLKQDFQIVALFCLAFIRIAENDHEPGGAGSIFLPPRDRRNKRVRHIRKDERQRVRAARAQAPGQSIRHIAEIGNGRLNTVAHRLGHIA